jgi:hypothetical protein
MIRHPCTHEPRCDEGAPAEVIPSRWSAAIQILCRRASHDQEDRRIEDRMREHDEARRRPRDAEPNAAETSDPDNEDDDAGVAGHTPSRHLWLGDWLLP